MKIKYILFIILIFYNCSVVDRESPSNAPTIVTGTVIDTTTGEPIDSVEVELSRKTKFSIFPTFPDYIGPTYSNSSGEFYIKDNYIRKEDDDFLSYDLSVGKNGYNYQFFDIEENEVNEFDIALNPWKTDFHSVVKGYFLEKETNDPIEDVKVYLSLSINSLQNWNVVDSSSTNNTGYFLVEDYYKREINDITFYYQFDFHKDGYDHPRYSINVINDGVREVTLYLSPISG